MLKLEIKLDEAKIKSENKYDVISIYQTLEKSFFKYDIPMNKEKDGTLVFYGRGHARDYGAFGAVITSLKEKGWFIDYVIKWVWYNSDDGLNEEDYSVEDVLYHYTRRISVA